jgi:poly [ADP-ribose] polymerase
MIDGEVKEMMELMLYGGLVRNPNASENPKKATSWSSFSAPYEQLSHWTIFVAFKSLECISKQLGSQHPIRWKAIIAASSRYRSRIPFCAEGNRVPVISSYHAVFIELKFLYSLWPQQDIASLASKIHSRASLQINEYKSLTQPLYHAYSSLRHGFRRLTDTSTTEHKELENYLLRSRHSAHYIKFEVKEIYKVFVKAGVPNSYNNWIDNTLGHEFCAEHRLLLWHGTPLSSLLGILDLGLQIRRPGANWTGTMFGNGIYLADVSSKSAGYCQQRLGEGEAVLLLCEADVGAHRIKSRNSIHNANDIVEISAGIHRCIEGTGRIQPAKWKPVEWEAGGLPSTAGGRVLMVCTRNESS